jgi:hypothetical protein
MITDKGKSVIAKYMIGQTPAYASYIAIGCGPKPVLPSHTFDSGEITAMAAKETLDFETLRVPIISRGYITQTVGGIPVSQLVLTAQLPAESRYGITEVGLYPAASNPVAVNNDSRMLTNFSNSEAWSVVNYSNSADLSVVPDGTINTTTPTTIFANSLDATLTNQTRILASEIPRNGTTSLVVPGTLTTFTAGAPSGGKYLLLENPGIDLSGSSPVDKLRIAFSAISPGTSGTITAGTTATIIVEFGNTKEPATGGYARATFTKTIGDISGTQSRYFVAEINVSQITSNNFSWSNAQYMKVYVSTSNSAIIAIDGLRVDNVSSESPVYGLVGYTVIKNSLTTTGGSVGAVPAVKEKDKTSLVEFRFQIGLQQ